MKGLYVYGSLCMAFSFVVGMQAHSPRLMAVALAAAALSALGEAGLEVLRAHDPYGDRPALVRFVNGIAWASWLVTGVAIFFALNILIGGV